MKIAVATAQGRLGCSAKISCNSDVKSTFVCCVYVNDFTDLQEVKRVLLNLIDVVGKKNVSGFKPDVFTEMKIRCTMYKIKKVLEW